MKNNTFSNGCLGSHNDEERSEMRYVMRIAQPRVIKSLNANGDSASCHVRFSVTGHVTDLNAIEAILSPSLGLLGLKPLSEVVTKQVMSP